MEAPITLTIEIRVQNGSLICGRRGGNVRVREGDRVIWVSERPFTLEFFRTAEETETEAPEAIDLPGWPFADPVRPEDVARPTTKFEGVVGKTVAGYKYYVTSGNLRLDPIFIVDKH